MKKYFFVVVALWMSGIELVNAQSCTISFSGHVLDRSTGEPLEFSSIAVEETNDYILSDSVGFFSLADVCPGVYHVQVFHLGCPPEQYYLSILRDTICTFYLDHHGELLQEVVVEGAANSLQASKTQKTISASVIRESSGSSLAEITERVSGVRTLRNGAGIAKPIIHGLYGNRVALINNGLIQAGQQWGADHAPEIDPNAANTITVVKGSDAIAYGSQALGGALLIDVGPIPDEPHLHGNFGYNFSTNGKGHTLTGMLNKTTGKFGWRVTGTFKSFGDHHTPDYFLTNTGARELNGSAQVVVHSSEQVQHQLYYSLFTTTQGIFAGAIISNLTDLENAIGRDVPFNINDYFSYQINPPKQQVDHHLLKYSGKKFIDEHAFLEWIAGGQYDHRQEFDVRRGNRSEIPALDLSLLAGNVQLKYVNDRGRLAYKMGSQMSYTDNSNSYDTGILPLIPDYLKGSIGGYALVQYPLQKFMLEGGVRYDLQLLKAWPITLTLPREIEIRQHTFHDYALSIGGAYTSKRDEETRLQMVLARRSPEPNELYSNGLHQGVAGIEEGNWNLNPELSFKTIITQSFQLNELFHFEVSLFSHLFDDYIYLQPEDELRLTIRGAYPVYRYAQDNAWIRGADLIFVSDFSHHLEWNGKVSWVKGTNLEDQLPLSLMPALYASSGISWAFEDTHVFRSSRFTLEGSYTAQQTNWNEESELIPPPEDYFLLGLKLTSGLLVNHRVLTIGVTISNLLNIRYRDYLNRLRYFSDEQGIDVRINIQYKL